MKKFSTSENGYNKEEVQKFVNDVTREYGNMLEKLKNSDKEIFLLNQKLNHYKNIETTLNKAVLIAEDSSNQIKKLAQDEAKMIISDAKKNASHIINDALIKAETAELEADKLRRSLKIYKARIKQTIEEQLVMVDDVDLITEEYKG